MLIVDDEASIRRALTRALDARGYEVESAVDGKEALAFFESFSPDLVVLDLNMPELDGFGVCRQLRTWSSVPIIVLSVREDESDKVEALDLGADDYLTKPFGTDELLARVRAQLRRTKDALESPRYINGPLVIDLGEHRVTKAGIDVRLTKTEWGLMEELARHPGKLLTHSWLLDHVWGPGYTDDVDVLRVFVSQLRHKIEADPARPSMIVTEPGVGYRWTARPERATVKDPSGG